MIEREPRPNHTPANELSPPLRELLAYSGYGCLAVESDNGIVHICHASDHDIAGFRGAPVQYQWQLILMPNAPLIRLLFVVLDDPTNPYQLESFLNVAEADQAQVLSDLVEQEQFSLAFYGDDLSYRYTKVFAHEPINREQLATAIAHARLYWDHIGPAQQNFDLAKMEFMAHFI
ncbi:MAG: hypothetical protein H6667_25460 [Ardenticatenaceae bacterium]|nr:hypothetical protein [Ardenticatenaceae bacterium]